ncbi:MAG: Fe-S cluster assembly protein SufD [Alphaproteobacteria bacterium]|nr:Fe-S cluster assembly protein SufD [Alphaproteobacteria bacterium]
MSLLQNINLWGDDIPYLSGLREKNRISFEKRGLPDSKTEDWRFSYFKQDDMQNPVIDNEPIKCEGHCHSNDKLPFNALQIRYCNGKLHIEDWNLPNGVVIKSLIEAVYDGDIKSYLNKSFNPDDFPFAALNGAYLEQGLFILIERGTVLSEPLYIKYHNSADKNRLCNIRNTVVAENGAKATVIEHFCAEENAVYTQNVVNEIFVGNNAELNHYVWQNEAKSAHHISLNSVQVKSGGNYSAFCANGTCKFSRYESYVRLLQSGAAAEINGVYKLSETEQVCDITTNIRHLSPHTYSNQLVKGVAKVRAKGVFQGQIHIAPDAQQCEGHQLHRALLLNDGAEIDCKPELEVFADDVKCSHGASSGDLDKEQIFYMQARGISEDEARKILVDAYLNEVFALNKNPDISEWIKEQF